MPKRPSSLDLQSIDTAIHVNPGSLGQERPGRRPEQPKRSLRRDKGRISDKGVLRALGKLGGNKSSSSPSDPGNEPNRPNIVPPLHDSSDPERSSVRQENDVERRTTSVEISCKVRCGLSPQEKLSEITELVRVRTASAEVILRRLAERDYDLDGHERQHLLEIARAAADVASKEYARVRRTRPKLPLARMLERNAEVPFADVQHYSEYLWCLQLQVKGLQGAVWGPGRFREVSHGVADVRKYLDEMHGTIQRGDLAADMTELQWWVERKFMFWAAVDILISENAQSEQAEVTDD